MPQGRNEIPAVAACKAGSTGFHQFVKAAVASHHKEWGHTATANPDYRSGMTPSPGHPAFRHIGSGRRSATAIHPVGSAIPRRAQKSPSEGQKCRTRAHRDSEKNARQDPRIEHACARCENGGPWFWPRAALTAQSAPSATDALESTVWGAELLARTRSNAQQTAA